MPFEPPRGGLSIRGGFTFRCGVRTEAAADRAGRKSASPFVDAPGSRGGPLGRDASPGLIGEPRWDRHECRLSPREGAFPFVAAPHSDAGFEPRLPPTEQGGKALLLSLTRQAAEAARWDGTRVP